MAVISSDRGFLFLLAPGTGSTVVANALVEEGIGRWFPDQDMHLGSGGDGFLPRKHTHYEHFRKWELLQGTLSETRIVTTVRNPFDFWVSEYLRHRNRWSNSLSDPESHIYRRKGGAEAVAKAVELEFGEWLKDRWHRFGEEHTQLLHPQFTRYANRVLRFEMLGESFQEWLRDEGFAEPVRLRRENTTQRQGDYREYYDTEARNLVERIFRPYLERFDYSF
jgi:hypothetical protein